MLDTFGFIQQIWICYIYICENANWIDIDDIGYVLNDIE